MYMVLWRDWKRVSKGDYMYARIPEHPNATAAGYVLEHRIVMENHIGRLLEKGEVVHHRGEDKKENVIENLKLYSNHGHNEFHSNEKKVPMIKLECAYCGKSFERKGNKVRYARKKGQVDFFCSCKCNGKVNH